LTERIDMAESAILDMEPALKALFAARAVRRALPAYSARKTEDIVAALTRFFAVRVPGAVAEKVSRLGGGASKEQFVFTLEEGDDLANRYVLRMDPLEALTETDRKREFEILDVVQGIVPAPRPRWMDETGEYFGRPAAIMEFVGGVTKPRGAGVKVSGLGTWLGESLRAKLRKPFLDNLVALHAMDWRAVALPSFTAPSANRKQAALWSLNYWRQLWREDALEPIPIMTYTEQWLNANLPDCDELVLTHGDYRTGNYLFDEDSGNIVAMLDWELARIGDFHEDLAWVLMRIFATFDNGLIRASDLYEREEFIGAYEAASGRKVNRKTLHFYDIMSSWRCFIIVSATGMRVARAQHNHQDVLLTFLGATGAMFAADICRLLGQREPT
jgi:aminoglycoside phosphotransferase (APT) family kinase protein